MRLLRLAAAALFHDMKMAAGGGTWQMQPLNEDLNADHRLAIAEVRLLSVRVRDAEVRELADQFRAKAAALAHASDLREAETALLNATEIHKALNDRIGLLIRDLDDDSD